VESGERPPPAVAPPPHRRRFGIGSALACFAALIGGQVVGGFFGAVLALVTMGLMGVTGDRLALALPPALLLGMSFAAAAVLGTTRLLLGGPIRTRGREAFALLPSTPARIALGAVAGAALFALLGILGQAFPPHHRPDIARVASESRAGHLAVLLMAVLIAPPLEEFLFRGVMYHGFRSRMPPVAAATIVTVLFVAMHATELRSWWPGYVVIGLLGAVTMALRMGTRSLWPPLATHVVYNLLVTGVL